MKSLTHGPGFAAAYRADRAPSLTLLSLLADGADRIVAEAALSADFASHVIMPFAQSTYESDLQDAANLHQFREMAKTAELNSLQLEGARGQVEPAS